MPEGGPASVLLLLANAGLARARRRGQHLGFSGREQAEFPEILRPESAPAGAGAVDQLRTCRPHLVRHAAQYHAAAEPRAPGLGPSTATGLFGERPGGAWIGRL